MVTIPISNGKNENKLCLLNHSKIMIINLFYVVPHYNYTNVVYVILSYLLIETEKLC